MCDCEFESTAGIPRLPDNAFAARNRGARFQVDGVG
jgi:hypothetical protein